MLLSNRNKSFSYCHGAPPCPDSIICNKELGVKKF
nr:MAG TPA: hypothetical protein [Caudoviricetes sp.]